MTGKRLMLRRRSSVCGLLVVLFVLVAAPSPAQVPQDTTFTGRLLDAVGAPLAGPVNLELRVFDATTAGTELYAESHSGVALDATGAFAVRLGQGSPLSGSFDAALFAQVDRWLEVVVGAEVLPARHPIASVPWALVAQQANEIAPDLTAPRFEDCEDGTVADRQTGLLWEQKTGAPGSGVVCSSSGCPDPHDVNNLYAWSLFLNQPDGNAFNEFLATLNDPQAGAAASATDPTGCLAGHCDWRLPNSVELQTILDCGSGPPCIDPSFGATVSSPYWSAATSLGLFGGFAWTASFLDATIADLSKTGDLHVRAVRAGSCE